MLEQQWGRRRSDDQPYPKARGREVLPRGLKPVDGTRRERLCPKKPYGFSSYNTEEEAGQALIRIEENLPEYRGCLKVKQAGQPHLLALSWMVTDKSNI